MLIISIFLQVVSFEDMQNGDGPKFLKPIFCQNHPSENIKYFCVLCQVIFFFFFPDFTKVLCIFIRDNISVYPTDRKNDVEVEEDI